jgi:hypothetical protein
MGYAPSNAEDRQEIIRQPSPPEIDSETSLEEDVPKATRLLSGGAGLRGSWLVQCHFHLLHQRCSLIRSMWNPWQRLCLGGHERGLLPVPCCTVSIDYNRFPLAWGSCVPHCGPVSTSS